jgi:Kef-type K+ transport system membrane component KefB
MVATSIGITARVLREMNLLATREARVILGAAVIDDILGILILTIAIGAASGGVNLYQIAIVAALATVFVLASLTLGPRLVRHMARPESPAAIPKRMRSHNAPFVVAILFCLGMSALASFFQLAAIIGAFLAGMAMAEIREQSALEHSFEPINAFFVPFFFLVIGLKVDLEALAAVWPLAVVLTVLAVVSKLLGCGIGARSMGRTSATIVGVGMVPRGEVGIIVALAGLNAGAVTGSLYSAVVVMSLATSMMAPSLLARLFRRLEAERMGPPRAAEP